MPPLPPRDKKPTPSATEKPDVRLAVTVHSGAMSPEQVERVLQKPAAPEVRLAMGRIAPTEAEAMALRAPDVRLALMSNQGGASGKNAIGLGAPNVRLAHGPGAQGDNVLIGQRGVAAMPDDSLPALLVSYFYLPQFLENRHRYHYRDWVMDSGAFSAHNSGVEINLQDYIECCKKLMVEDPTLTEIYSLDVIGDWKGSLKNTEEMWSQGVPAIPCFHVGEPWDALIQMAKDYPKIAFGGVAQIGSKKAMAWAGQCFARVWPKKVHGFAMCNQTAVLGMPFHSVDSTSWEIGPCKYGQWKAFGNQRVSVRGSKQNLRIEVEWYLELERKARVKWRKQMEELETIAPTVRLALAGVGGDGSSTGPRHELNVKALGPVVRLADSGEGGRIEGKVAAFRAVKKKGEE